MLVQRMKQHHLNVFVETGTYRAHTLLGILNGTNCKQAYSIELSEELYTQAQQVFKNNSRATLLCGDSGVLIRSIITELKEPALFWLDAHYSAGITARGDKDTPILSELESIAESSNMPHHIMIDDVRHFGVIQDYPSLKTVQEHTDRWFPNHCFYVHQDMIHIIPKA